MRMSIAVLLALSSVLWLLGASLPAAEERPAVPLRDRLAREAAAGEEAEAPEMEEEEEEWEGGMEEDAELGMTLRLTFHLPDERERPPIFLLLATRQFSYLLDFGGRQNRHRFSIEGTVDPVEEGGDVLLRYAVELKTAGENHEVVMAAEGSAILRFGPPRPLVLLGDRELLVGVRPEEATPAEDSLPTEGRGETARREPAQREGAF